MIRSALWAPVVFWFCCAARISWGDTTETPTRSLTLNEAVQAALLHNRDLQIERINTEIARSVLKSSYGYYDPLFLSQGRKENSTDSGGFDPADFSADAVFSAESEVANAAVGGVLPLTGLRYNVGGSYAHSFGSRNFLNFDSHKIVTGITLQQPLLKNFWTDQGRTVIRINKRNLKITELGVRFVAMNVINQIEQGYYDLIFAWENMRLQRDLHDTRESFLKGIQQQVEVGTMTVLEEKLAQSQVARIEVDLISSLNAVALAGNNLKLLVGLGASNWTENYYAPLDSIVVMPEDFDVQSSWRKGIKERPDLLQLAQDVEKANLDLKYRKNQLFPSLDLIGSYGRRGASALQVFPPDRASAPVSGAFDQISSEAAPSHMFGLIFSIPIGNTAERGNYRASKQVKEQAKLRVAQKEEIILREISDAVHNARSSYARIDAAKLAMKRAEEALAAEEEKLRGGKSSIFVVLQLQSDLGAARSGELQARLDYNKALAQWHFAEGTTLERRNIVLDLR